MAMLDWSIHRCSYYCRDGVHAVPLLAAAVTTREAMMTHFAGGLDTDEALVDIIPAREVDIAAWIREFFQNWTAWGEKGEAKGQGCDPPAALTQAPWLALIAYDMTKEAE